MRSNFKKKLLNEGIYGPVNIIQNPQKMLPLRNVLFKRRLHILRKSKSTTTTSFASTWIYYFYFHPLQFTS